MSSISLQQVNKRFDAGPAVVRDLTLDIAHGELLVLVGPSGCGKSTVLRLVSGLDTPTSGRILVDGTDVTGQSPQERDMAMVFQSYALYPHMSVRQNLAFGLRMRGAPAGTIEPTVARTAGMLGITELLDRRPAQLSGGQRQRVALGRALARDARAFLLDEPLSNLDPLLRVETRTELGLLHRRIGATMIYVTHDQEEAMTLGTRIAVMNRGALEQVGPPMDVYRRPASRFVASFVGSPSMNLCAGRCVREGGGWRLSSPSLTRDLLLPDATVPLPENVEVGFRPQDAELCPPADGDLAGQVAAVEAMGALTLLHVRLGESAGALIRLTIPPDIVVHADEHIGIRLKPERLHLFDGSSGVRVV